jgi:uncharacterized repeat protein (TIGR04076 family)
MAHFVSKPGEPFDWKAFQKHVGMTDKELEEYKKDPHRAEWLPKLCSPDIQNKTLIFEVVESNTCPAGMKVGDRLYFKGSSVLDTKRSSPWCAKAFETQIAFISMSTFLQANGVNANDMYYDHYQCGDAGAKFGGFGHCIIKAFVVDESKGEYKG